MESLESKQKLTDLKQRFHDVWLRGTGWQLEAGELCYQIKSLCDHGEWGAFLDEYDIPRSTADDWIRRYKDHAGITETRQFEEPNPPPAPDQESKERQQQIKEETDKRKGKKRQHNPSEVTARIRGLLPHQTALYWSEREGDKERVDEIWLQAFYTIIRSELLYPPPSGTELGEVTSEEEPCIAS
jgi:hypothetical protein